MADEKEFEALKGRIVELENRLKKQDTKPMVAELKSEEIEAYVKVRDMIANDHSSGCVIGTPPTQPCVLARCYACYECFECIAPRYNIGQMGSRGGGFSGLGGF